MWAGAVCEVSLVFFGAGRRYIRVDCLQPIFKKKNAPGQKQPPGRVRLTLGHLRRRRSNIDLTIGTTVRGILIVVDGSAVRPGLRPAPVRRPP